MKLQDRITLASRLDQKALAERVRLALVQSGASQHKFSVLAEINPQTLSRFLSGQTWSASTAGKLERALARLPRRKSPKHRRINLEGANHGKA